MSLFGNYNTILPCCEKMEDKSGIDKFPRLWYHYFLSQRRALEDRRIYSGKDTIKKLLKYAIGKETKLNLYDSLRHKTMDDIPSSKVVREFIGICMLIHGLFEYFKLSIQMWWIKR